MIDRRFATNLVEQLFDKSFYVKGFYMHVVTYMYRKNILCDKCHTIAVGLQHVQDNLMQRPYICQILPELLKAPLTEYQFSFLNIYIQEYAFFCMAIFICLM